MLSKPLSRKIKFDKYATAKIIKWTPNKIVFKTNVKSKSRQFLNISEIYYPTGWVVTNDNNKDQNIEIYEVNSLIRGILVDTGENTYTMEYKPDEVKRGSMISFMSFIILCSLIFIGFRNENKKSMSYNKISGTEYRKLLLSNQLPESWLARPKISQMLLDSISNGEKVFVE